MSWLKKLFGKGDDEAEKAAPAESSPGMAPMDSLQTEEERAEIRAKMERELEEARQGKASD